jgi:hypothetical protein
LACRDVLSDDVEVIALLKHQNPIGRRAPGGVLVGEEVALRHVVGVKLRRAPQGPAAPQRGEAMPCTFTVRARDDGVTRAGQRLVPLNGSARALRRRRETDRKDAQRRP